MEAEICIYIHIYIYIYIEKERERERETSLEKQGTRSKRNHIVHNTIVGKFYTPVWVRRGKSKKSYKACTCSAESVCVCVGGWVVGGFGV